MECCTPAIYHAPPFFLVSIDRVQSAFLHELDVTPEEALLDFNLASLSSRRDISMLVLPHRGVLGDATVQFNRYVRARPAAMYPWG